MKHQVLFSLKNNEKYLRISSATVVTGALRAKMIQIISQPFHVKLKAVLFVNLKLVSHGYYNETVEVCSDTLGHYVHLCHG